MKNKAIMVTGGAGFIGSHLVDKLLSEGAEVHIFDYVPLKDAKNLENARECDNFHYYQGDLRSQKDVCRFWRDEADVIYHLASVVGVGTTIDDPLNLVDVVVLGTRYILEEAARTKTRVVFASSSEIYGRNPVIPWSESDERVLGPTYVDRWSYANAKGICEHMLYGMQKKRDLPFSVVRFFNVYGPRQVPAFFTAYCIHCILNGTQPTLHDDGSSTRCYTYIDDVIEGLLSVAVRDEALGEVFNMGSSVETSAKVVAEMALKACGSEIGYRSIDTKEELGKTFENIQRRVPMVDKIYEKLGWKATVQIEDGIKRMVKWAHDNPWWLNKL